jgi:DNA-binding NarL/FixJ family response regulator
MSPVETVLIVDDHAMFRRLVRRVLEEAGFVVVGEAADAASVVPAVRELAPDVVLLDVLLPDGSGIDVAVALAELAGAGPPAVVLTSSRARTDLGPALDDAPVAGFVPKNELTAASFRGVFRQP